MLRLALVLLAFASCTTPNFSVQPRYAKFEPDGHLSVAGTAGSVGVSSENSVEDIGLQEDDSVPGILADLRSGIAHWTFAWQESENGGTGTLQAELSDDDVSIAAGTQVDSIFDLGLGQALVTFDFIPGDTFELGAGLGATLVNLDVSVTDATSGDTIEPDEELFPVPVLAVRGGVQLWRVDVQALLSGIDLSYDDNDASLYDLDVFARLSLFGRASRAHGALLVGYRRMDLDVDYDDDDDTNVEADISFDGPYVGLSLGI